MTEYAIVKLGNPTLRVPSQPIHNNEFESKELHHLINTLFFAMEKEGGIGIAAPQIGINKRIFVFGMDNHPVYTQIESIPYTVLINPAIHLLTEETEESYEGCLSVGSLRGKVLRPKRVRFTGFDVSGRLIEKEVEGLHARVVQHEYDHLDGIVFLDKVTNHASLGFHDELIASGELKTRSQPEQNGQ